MNGSSEAEATAETEGPASAPEEWWEDFVMDDWVCVAQRMICTDLQRRIRALDCVMSGRVTFDLMMGFRAAGLGFEIGDPLVQERTWAAFFQVLMEVTYFGKEVEAYHEERYGRPHESAETIVQRELRQAFSRNARADVPKAGP